MRRLRLVVRRARGSLPLVVAAGVLGAPACGETEGNPGVGGTAGNTNVAGAGGNSGMAGAVVILDPGPEQDAGPTGPCPNGFGETFTVELPPEGVPAEPGQICAAEITPVQANRVARVSFDPNSSPNTTSGTISIHPDVLAGVVGTPTLEIMDATRPDIMQATFDNVVAADGGFTFDVTWQTELSFHAYDMDRLTVRVVLELECPGGTEIVHSVTDIHLCRGEMGESIWVSSGDQCTVCRVIAEMAPSPIVPERHADMLPLAHALRLRVVELARISNTVVLLAENDGGEGLEYEWHASGGKLTRLAPDVVAWTLEEGEPAPFIQAAVWGATAAAVASFAFNDRAA